jgi:hypothetical protein
MTFEFFFFAKIKLIKLIAFEFLFSLPGGGVAHRGKFLTWFAPRGEVIP